MNRRVKVIIRNLIIGLAVTAIAAVAFQWYYGSIYTGYIIILGVLATVIISKAFLLPFANKRIEGTVIKTTVKTYMDRRLKGSTPGRPVGSLRTGVGSTYSSRLRIAVVIKTIQGHKFLKRFDYYGEADEIPVGAKIRFTIFDDEPEILHIPKTNNKHK